MDTSSEKARQDYIDLVKDQLEDILDQEENEVYELAISKEQLALYAKAVCSKIEGFKEDKWQLAEIVAGTIWEAFNANLPGANLVAHLVLKIFRKGVHKICFELNGD